MKSFLTSIFSYTAMAWQNMINEKHLAVFSAILAALLEFMLKSIQIDIFLFFLLIASIAVNTWSGIRLAKKKEIYNLKVLRESVTGKLLGYLILLIALSIFIMVLFVASLRDAEQLVPDYWLNLLMVLLLVFLSSIEFKSTLENLEALGINIPLFVKKIPEKVQDKIDDLTDLSK
ncbi:phage holin family protein [Jiulongibacter sediminis]|uniref:phage holin family protein n=1 Tax=Jiulongibacter sediminis TaxID=1605367 RepID=UPI0026ED329F|nr:phage holin family protein [Jiulongibacter sediminis]